MAKAQTKEDEKILAEAKKRFAVCEEWEAIARSRFVEDIKFANADPENGYQWAEDTAKEREISKKPKLTINKVRQHNLIVINDAKQNKPGVVIKPNGGDATYASAQIYENIVRRIEYISNAEQAYDTATTFQVQGGIGYLRVLTDYVDDGSFDQEIYIAGEKNPLAIYLDPACKQIDGSDARFGFVFDTMDKEDADDLYPEHKGELGDNAVTDGGWLQKDRIRIAEYWRKVQSADTLIAYDDPETGERRILRASELDKETLKTLRDTGASKEREIVTDKVEWFKIAGNSIVDRKDWPGRYIPIVPVIGEQTVIDGVMDRKGHTRAMKDAQRLYNFWTSEAALQVSLQTKTPYIAPVESIGEYMEYWRNANETNYAVLPYRAFDDKNNPLPRPEREPAPQMAQAYVQGMQIAQSEMMMASGQYQSQFGQNENATSGKAINERQRQGDTATYHFIDGLGIAIRQVGKILIDLIPKIYDTPRVIRIIAEDGEEQHVKIDPQAPQAMQEAPAEEEGEGELYADKVKLIFNPNVGKYDVVSDIGPSYATQRQEAWNAFSQIVSQNPQLVHVVGDLLFRNADFPGADEIARRLKRMVPPNVLGDAPPPAMAQMQQQMQQMHEIMENMHGLIQQKDAQLASKGDETSVKAYDAETKRIAALGAAAPNLPPEQIAGLVSQMVQDALATHLQAFTDAQMQPGEQADPSASAGQTATTGAPGAIA